MIPRTLHPRFLRELSVDPAGHPRGQPHLGAASGLAAAGPFLYVVADDEHHLGVLDTRDPDAPLRLLRVLGGELPHDKRERKRRKADLEALLVLPPLREAPHGALLALGSGSRRTRERGWLLALDAAGGVASAPRELDLAPLLEPLRGLFDDLNLEGAFLAGGGFHLLQRANAGSARNACIRYEAAALLEWLQGAAGPPPAVLQVRDFALGDSDGIPFGFTDATPLPDGGWLFSAAAEDTGDSYADGACAGSLLGHVAPSGELQDLWPLAGAPKVEGIALQGDGLLLVTDADDPAIASRLLRLPWPAVA